jgi:hypothetical protein
MFALYGHQHCPHPVLAYENTPCHRGKGRHIEPMGAQRIQCLIEIGIAGSSGHRRFQSESILKHLPGETSCFSNLA